MLTAKKVFLRPLRAVSVLLIATFLASAQDATQARLMAIGYMTLKNSAAMSPETRAEVDRLEKAARGAQASNNYGEAIKAMSHGMALMRGEAWTPLRALNAALAVKLDRPLAEPGQTIEVRVRQMFALDEQPKEKLTATVSLLTIPADPALKPQETVLKTLDAPPPDWATAPWVVKLPVPDVAVGNYRLAVALDSSTKKSALIHIERGLAGRFSAGQARCAKVEDKCKAGSRTDLLSALPPVQYRLALYDLATAGDIDFSRISFGDRLLEAEAALDALEAGRNPWTARRGDVHMAYRSKVDNTLQPYRLFVPAAYDGTAPFPLIIALHGAGGNENAYFDGYQNGLFKTLAGQRGYIVACPKGRDPISMYRGPAEQDVLDVLAEVRRAWKIDPERIFLTGHSMGGFGTWSVAMNSPGVFAALAPIAPAAFGIDSAGMAKIKNIPQLVVHGDNDKTLPVQGTRNLVETARKLGTEIKYVEIPGGGHVDVAAPTFKDVFDWFDAHRRTAAPE